MERKYQKKTTSFWTPPKKERSDVSKASERNRDRDRNRFGEGRNPKHTRQGGTDYGNNQPPMSFFRLSPPRSPSYSESHNRAGGATGSGYNYNQPRSLFDKHKEGEKNTEGKTDRRNSPNYSQSFENPHESEQRRDPYGGDNQMKRKEYDDKDEEDEQYQALRRRTISDTGDMISPLEGLYGPENTIPTGRGYGAQRFRFSRSDGNRKRRDGNKKKTDEDHDPESRDKNKTSGSRSPKKVECWDEPDEPTTMNKDEKKTSPKDEDWTKIDNPITGVKFGFYQEIPKEDNDSNTEPIEERGWNPPEEKRATITKDDEYRDRSPNREQPMTSPEWAKSWDRHDKNVNRRTGGNYGYYENRSTPDYNPRRNVREDWNFLEQSDSNYRHWSYNRGRNQQPRPRGASRNNYNRNKTRKVEDWDEETEASKTSLKIIEDWDEPDKTTKDKDDKNMRLKTGKDKPEEKLESIHKRDDDEKMGGEDEDDEEAQKQKERDRNFAALMRYIDEDWGPPQWPSRTKDKTDNEDESSDSPKEGTSSEDSKEKASSDPYDWITNPNTSERKSEVSRKSPDPIISKRSDSDEDSNTNDSPLEIKSTSENDNSVGSWETNWKCSSFGLRHNRNNDRDNPDSGGAKGNNFNTKNRSRFEGKTASNTNDGNKGGSKSSREKETVSAFLRTPESSKERERRLLK